MCSHGHPSGWTTWSTRWKLLYLWGGSFIKHPSFLCNGVLIKPHIDVLIVTEKLERIFTSCCFSSRKALLIDALYFLHKRKNKNKTRKNVSKWTIRKNWNRLLGLSLSRSLKRLRPAPLSLWMALGTSLDSLAQPRGGHGRRQAIVSLICFVSEKRENFVWQVSNEYIFKWNDGLTFACIPQNERERIDSEFSVKS